MRTRTQTFLTVAFLLFVNTVALAVDITNIRVGVKKSFTRVVFDLSDAPEIYNVKYSSGLNQNKPDRILIDLNKGKVDQRAIKNTSSYPLIKKINGINIRNSGFSIEIELKESVRFKHFILPPAKNKGYRLVLDIRAGKPTIKKTQIIIPDKEKKEKIIKRQAVTDYKSDAIELYDQTALSDATIEQLFSPFQGTTQLKDFYAPEVIKTTPKKVKPKAKINPNVPHFEVRGYQVKGNTLLTKNILVTLLKPHTGKNKNFGDIQKALESLEQRYQKMGFGMVQVYLPEQELDKGIVRFNIIEPKVDVLKVEGAKHFDLSNIQKSMVSLKEGETPNTRDIAANLVLINENPAKKTTVQFLPGKGEGVLNTLINVKDKSPSKYSLALDNTGTESTGKYRLGIAYQHANLTNNDDILNLQYTMSEKSNTLHVYGLSYHYPLYSLNSSLDFFGGYSTVDSGVIANSFTVSGKGTVLGTRFNQVLSKQGNYAQRLSYGLDYRSYNTDAIPLSGGGSIIPDIAVHPLSLTYSGQWSFPTSATGFNFQLHYNAFTSSKDDTEFSASRTGAKPNYLIYRYGVEHAQTFAKTWQMRFALSGQETSNALVSGEQFGIGGATSVRGYNERDVSNDKGFQATAEIYTPNYADSLWMKGADARFLFFYDLGQVSRNKALAGETTSSKLSSVGAGFRVNYHDKVSFKLDFASSLKSSLTQNKGETKIHANLIYIF